MLQQKKTLRRTKFRGWGALVMMASHKMEEKHTSGPKITFKFAIKGREMSL